MCQVSNEYTESSRRGGRGGGGVGGELLNIQKANKLTDSLEPPKDADKRVNSADFD